MSDFEITVNQQNELMLSEKAKAIMMKARQLEILQKEVKEQYEDFRESLKIAMENNNIKKAQFLLDDGLIAECIYKDEYMKKSIDTQKLKDEGLYEAFAKNVKVSSSVSLKWKEQ